MRPCTAPQLLDKLALSFQAAEEETDLPIIGLSNVSHLDAVPAIPKYSKPKALWGTVLGIAKVTIQKNAINPTSFA